MLDPSVGLGSRLLGRPGSVYGEANHGHRFLQVFLFQQILSVLEAF
jgi:hypothetical protein